MSSAMTTAEIDAILAKVAKQKDQRKLAQQKYKAKEGVKEINAIYMRQYRAKKKAKEAEEAELLNILLGNTSSSLQADDQSEARNSDCAI